MRRIPLLLAVLGLLYGGCQQPVTRLNAPPHGTTDVTSDLHDTYEHMTDNALLANMSIGDIHFLPHRPMLNSLGEQRLGRLAALLNMYGGIIRFDTRVRDEALIAERTESIMDYLASKGVDTTSEILTRDLPGGRGMDASQAIMIRANEGVYKPKKKKEGAY